MCISEREDVIDSTTPPLDSQNPHRTKAQDDNGMEKVPTIPSLSDASTKSIDAHGMPNL